MTFVKTKLKLAQMAQGDVLEVLLTDGEPLNNVPRSAAEQGYKVLGVEHVEGDVHKVTIQK
jgi:TusA-related sulfurtransferase